jgi:hypothetical protein
MKPLILAIAVMAVVLSVCAAVARAADLSPVEARQIEALIGMVERLTDAAFIRNGRPYDAATAAEFLRRKWRHRETEVYSADDFIEQVASSSSTTGLPYLVRFSDGREIPCSAFLRTELKRLRKQEQRMDCP